MSQFDVPKELLVNENRVKVSIIMEGLINNTQTIPGRSVTPGHAKDYFEFLELVKKAVDDYQTRSSVPSKRQLDFSWERPDTVAETEKLSISLLSRQPGAFQQGAPNEAKIRNQAPILREKKEDPDNPGYLNLVYGKFYDNMVGFTIWSLTNKEVIERAFWFEDLMEKYNWFFKMSGVNRVIFSSQEEDTFVDNDGKRIYGRKLIYFVRTEKITTVSEKVIEDVYINLSVGNSI